MTTLNIQRTRDLLQKFDFKSLFIEELGWSQPSLRRSAVSTYNGAAFEQRQIADLSGVVVFEITAQDGSIPDAKTRAAIHKDIAKLHHENLLIFLDQKRTQSLWYWVKREDGKSYAREHLYTKGQPGDLFLSKLGAMVVDLSDFDETGAVPVVEVASRLKSALDVEKVTKKFYKEFSEQHLAFLELIQGIDDERQRRWYASVLLNRLMFIYFLQRKHFLDNGNLNYLQDKLNESRQTLGKDKFFSAFLTALFFEGFAKPEEQRSPDARRLLGNIKYLNGGLFLPHAIELANPKIQVPDQAFENLLNLFGRYSWNLNDTPGGDDNEINPDVLGYIFEKYINQKAFGAYYTRPEITEYLCEQTIFKLVLEKVTAPDVPGLPPARRFDSIADLLLNLDVPLCKQLLLDVLPSLSLLDPACGSGAFLVAAMRTLISLYSAIIGKIEFLHDRTLTEWLHKVRKEHPSLAYFIKKRIITDNLFGVDIMEEATEIAKLRLFLALVASAQTVEQLEPLPNIDFNILAGNSLIGLMRVNDEDFERRHAQGELFRKSYSQLLSDKNRQIKTYRHATTYGEDLRTLRDDIEKVKKEASKTLNEILLEEFTKLGIKFEQATWDNAKKVEGKPKKQALAIADISALQPFHWGYEFDEIINQRGGFDVVIANPPWEVFQTNEKEFFQQYAPSIQKKKLRIEDWEKQREQLLTDPEIRADWLAYASRFPHQWAYFKQSSQYANQTTTLNDKTVGNKLNLYSLFTEQCFNLLRPRGYCGIVLPSGIYTDLGTKQLRQMLFDKTEITGLFCFENRKEIFEGVHRSFKFVVLTFEKFSSPSPSMGEGQGGGESMDNTPHPNLPLQGGKGTISFPAAFMRHEVAELEYFPQAGALQIDVGHIYKISPDSLSIPEFKDEQDLRISSKLLEYPLLADPHVGWGLELYGEELNMTRSSKYFRTTRTKCPVYEGGMIWHFEHQYSEPRYWVQESELRKSFLDKRTKRITDLHQIPKDLKNDYEVYRIAIRKIASNTNERTLISTVIPPYGFAGNSLSVNFPFCHDKDRYNELRLSSSEILVVVALLNSLVADFTLRSRMTTNLNLFYLYQLPIPRFQPKYDTFDRLVERTAKLICTTQEFDDLAREVGLKSHKNGVTDPVERAKLRAELDGLIAHLYDLTEEEFTYILTTFPLVPEPVKVAAQNAYRDVERGLIK